MENVARGSFHQNLMPNFTTPLAEKNGETFTPHFCRVAALRLGLGVVQASSDERRGSGGCGLLWAFTPLVRAMNESIKWAGERERWRPL